MNPYMSSKWKQHYAGDLADKLTGSQSGRVYKVFHTNFKGNWDCGYALNNLTDNELLALAHSILHDVRKAMIEEKGE